MAKLPSSLAARFQWSVVYMLLSMSYERIMNNPMSIKKRPPPYVLPSTFSPLARTTPSLEFGLHFDHNLHDSILQNWDAIVVTDRHIIKTCQSTQSSLCLLFVDTHTDSQGQNNTGHTLLRLVIIEEIKEVMFSILYIFVLYSANRLQLHLHQSHKDSAAFGRKTHGEPCFCYICLSDSEWDVSEIVSRE